MHDKLSSPRLAMDQRTARLEQVLNQGAQMLKRVPLKSWQFLVTLLLVLWISHSLARLFWMVIPEPQIPPAAVSLTPAVASGVEADTADIETLKKLQIFGQGQQTTAVEPVAAQVVETATVDTQLNLVLMGVIASSDESAGRAIIAANNQQEVYSPGAELPVGNGVTLSRVLDRRVILNNNGRYESLWLYQDSDSRRPATNYATSEQAASRSWTEENDTLATDPNQQPPLFVDKSPGTAMRGETGPTPDDVSAEIGRSIADVVAMSIHREGGQVVGYRIRPGRNAEQFAAFGLQADDIVTAVNGVPLNNPGKIMEIYKNMSNASSASLEIKRGSSVLSVDIVLP